MILGFNKIFFLFLLIIFTLQIDSFSQNGLNNTVNGAHTKKGSMHKPLKQIYKRPSKNKMYSNECVKDYTSQMGFEYVILTGDCEKALGNMSSFEIEFHNFSVAAGLFFTKGPFWKSKVKKRYKVCRDRMGDVID